MQNDNTESPKDALLGRSVGDGWNVVEKLGDAEIATGGNFSTGYIVEKNGHQAFLKAMDLTAAFLGDPATLMDRLNIFTAMFAFEQRLLEVCRERRLSRVVHLLDQGTILPPDETDQIQIGLQRVEYFIFELGSSDVRRTFGIPENGDSGARLKVLHDLALAIEQLHRAGIAHQDVKPSNVLTFSEDMHKLADLGRASMKGVASPTDKLAFPGDWSYAPPELLYGYVPEDYNERRFGTDAYLLGSMVAFLFTLQSATTLFQQAIPPQFLPPKWAAPGEPAWNGTFDDVLPHLVQAHARSCEYVERSLPSTCRKELTNIFFELTHPNPQVRGHPKSRREAGRLHGFNRYASVFDRLSRQARMQERIEARRKA